MRAFSLYIVLVGMAVGGFSQQPLDHAVYGSLGFDLGNFSGGSLALNLVRKESFSMQFGGFLYTRDAASTPSNYSAGLTGIFTLGLYLPRDKVTGFHALAGHVVYLNTKKKARINFMAGLSYVRTREPTNWRYINNAGLLENYDFDYQFASHLGGVLTAQFEFPIAHYAGFHIAPVIRIQRKFSVVALNMGVILGKIRGKRD